MTAIKKKKKKEEWRNKTKKESKREGSGVECQVENRETEPMIRLICGERSFGSTSQPKLKTRSFTCNQ